MTNKWIKMTEQTPDTRFGITKEGDKIEVYGDGLVYIAICKQGTFQMADTKTFRISHWRIAELPEEEG